MSKYLKARTKTLNKVCLILHDQYTFIPIQKAKMELWLPWSLTQKPLWAARRDPWPEGGSLLPPLPQPPASPTVQAPGFISSPCRPRAVHAHHAGCIRIQDTDLGRDQRAGPQLSRQRTLESWVCGLWSRSWSVGTPEARESTKTRPNPGSGGTLWSRVGDRDKGKSTWKFMLEKWLHLHRTGQEAGPEVKPDTTVQSCRKGASVMGRDQECFDQWYRLTLFGLHFALLHSAEVLFFVFFFNRLKSCGDPASSKSMFQQYLFAYFVSLRPISASLIISQTFSLSHGYGGLWSMTSDVTIVIADVVETAGKLEMSLKTWLNGCCLIIIP